MARRNPLFPYVYRVIAGVSERMFYARIRAGTLADARGRLLIIGLGPGYDLLHVPSNVTSVVAIEPDPAMRRMGRRLAARNGIDLELVDATGERLPFDTGSVDTVLCSLVLCSVDDVAAVLREIRRVLRDDGELLVLEHVRGADGSRIARLQDRFAHPWAVLSSGCEPNRRTADALAAAGFDVTGLYVENPKYVMPLVRPHLRGRSRVVDQLSS